MLLLYYKINDSFRLMNSSKHISLHVDAYRHIFTTKSEKKKKYQLSMTNERQFSLREFWREKKITFIYSYFFVFLLIFGHKSITWNGPTTAYIYIWTSLVFNCLKIIFNWIKLASFWSWKISFNSIKWSIIPYPSEQLSNFLSSINKINLWNSWKLTI